MTENGKSRRKSHKIDIKPIKNKKFKRNECRRVPEMNENYTQKQSNET